MTSDSFQAGDRVKIFLGAKFGSNSDWYSGTIIRIDPYSEHRSFYWVKLDADAQTKLGIKEISVFNPKNIARL
jgi:hypothetical protein